MIGEGDPYLRYLSIQFVITMSTNSAIPQEENVWLETTLKELSNEESINKIISVENSNGNSDGNCTSEVKRIKVIVSLGSGKEWRKSLVMKLAPKIADNPKVMKQHSIFKKEAKVYQQILTKFESIMNEFEDPNDKLWCKFYGFKSNYIILLEDLKLENYRLADRKNNLDVKHGLLVMNSLGRFHAISHYLLAKGLLSKTDLDSNIMATESPFIKRLVQGGIKQLSSVMEQHWPPEWKEIAEKLSNEVSRIYENVRELYSTIPEDGFLVMSHGDCWTSNMMFKYSPYEENTPIGVKFLDFQGSNFNSYLIDVIYFLYISIHPEVRKTNINRFLDEYHKSLAASLNFYGIAEETPSIEHVHKEFKRLELLGCFYNLIIFAVASADTGSALYFDKLATDCDAKDCYNPEIFIAEKYRLAVAEDLKYWIDQKII